MAEEILVIPTEQAVFHGLLKQGCNTLDLADLVAALVRGQFLLRCDELENNEQFKQLIPYVVALFRDPAHSSPPLVYAYRRTPKGGESRLHGKRSVGIGGHINSTDAGSALLALDLGTQRELKEEIKADGELEEFPYAAIYDGTTPVGRVHLGLVSRFFLEEPKVESLEEDHADDGLYPLPELLADIDNFETWSQFVLRAMAVEYEDLLANG